MSNGELESRYEKNRSILREAVVNISEKYLNSSNSSTGTTNSGLETTLPPYRDGEEVEVTVYRIVHYGVFVQTLDGYGYKGLIHISEVTDNFITDLRDYFTPGQRLKAKIKKVHEDGKVEFSTMDYDLSPNLSTINSRPENTGHSDSEYKEITEYLSTIVGALSPKAKERMRQVIKKHGLVKFSIAMSKVKDDFENDLGVLLINKIDKKIGDGL